MAKSPAVSRKSDPKTLADVPITNPQNLSPVYSNHFGVSATMTDFTIHFLEVGQVPGENGTTQRQEVVALVTLPMLTAVGMIHVLQELLQNQSAQMEEVKKMMTSGK